MSGFEIIGVVLGTFPLLISGAKGIRRVVEGTEQSWKFNTEFEDFIEDVEFENLAFSDLFNVLFESSTHLTQDELSSLRYGSDKELWQSTGVQKSMDDRLRREAQTWFIGQVIKVTNALDKLQDMLPVGRVWFPSPSQR